MRILRVITTMNPEKGGPCQGIRNSIPVLKAMGIENEVATFDLPGDDFLGKDGFIIHPLGPLKGPYNYCANLTSWLMANFRRYDVVIIHGLWLYNSYGTYRAWKKFKSINEIYPRLYIMPHGMLDPYFQKASDRKLKALRNILIWNLLEKQVINGINGVLFTCEQELVLARQTFRGYRPKSELNIKYGILPPPQYKESMQFELIEKFGNKPYLLFLSRIHPKKGVDILIKAYQKLKNKHFDAPKLIIAGPGLDTEYGKAIQKLASNDSDIIFPGMLKGAEKWGAIYGAEAFILPSHQENFGISVVEAMACGTPVVISDQVNIWSEIIKGKGGIVCMDNEQSTYEALTKWLELSVTEKMNLKEGALKTYSEYFTIEEAAKEMVKVLHLN